MWETLYGMVLAYPIVCYIFVPVYFSLGITSVYQYLDLRFKSRLVRCLASGTYVVRQLLNQGVTVFTPCVALNTVIGIPYWASIFGISLVSVIFTLLVSTFLVVLCRIITSIRQILSRVQGLRFDDAHTRKAFLFVKLPTKNRSKNKFKYSKLYSRVGMVFL